MGEYVLVWWKIQRVEMENNCGSQSQGNAQSNDYNRRHFFLIAGRMANDRLCRSDDCIRYCVSSFNSSGIWHRYCNSCVEFSSLHKMCARQLFKSSRIHRISTETQFLSYFAGPGRDEWQREVRHCAWLCRFYLCTDLGRRPSQSFHRICRSHRHHNDHGHQATKSLRKQPWQAIDIHYSRINSRCQFQDPAWMCTVIYSAIFVFVNWFWKQTDSRD